MKDTDERLQLFIDTAKSKGASDEGLSAILLREGWTAPQIYGALGDYWSRVTGLAIPARRGHGESSRDAFLYLLSFSTLATWACALGSLLFSLINRWLPDPVAPDQIVMFRESVTWQMASLAVAFPIYLLVMRRLVRETETEPERLQSGVRKWLTWISLLITAGTMIADLIWFLDYFLTGELTLRFVLKCLVVFAITGAIFAYYTASLRPREADEAPGGISRETWFGAGATAVAVVVFAAGLTAAGTPTTQRQTGADQRRVNDLRQIANVIWVYGRQNGALPSSLMDPLIRNRLGTNTGRDPLTNAPYEYHPAAGMKYELCAVFHSASNASTSFWNHPAGGNCFSLNASQAVPF